MSVTATVLFGKPQSEIASLIAQRIAQSNSTSIITGFATPGGVAARAEQELTDRLCRAIKAFLAPPHKTAAIRSIRK